MSNTDPNVPTKVFDPTESVRTLTSDLYTEDKMTLREHQDTDKHYIGDSLPVPSPSMAQAGGITSSVGVLPFPARADHTHETRSVYSSIGATGPVTVPPGKTFFNRLSWTGIGRSMLATSQVIALPTPGFWRIEGNLWIHRPAGGQFTGSIDITAAINNGGTEKSLFRRSNYDMGAPYVLEFFDWMFTTNAPSINDNWQFCIIHSDTVNWDVYLQNLTVVRFGAPTSA